ncbi:uncharacterized protein EAF02_009713 [Botrytis sinoallii]|uniref:uncharacterized protein n=1 Tax=Botrytis sinoallii TaxID=1463999 RepID=UPI00190138B1|nr:uncharacterized protein EAF02_009713 [Botrytis sinoallii]KAF7867522.1 hypothetical protein EAF02_009713 [Botrytis sinoallii]
MHFTYPLLYFLFLNITTAHQISYPFRTQKRQNGPDNADSQVNIHPEAAKALSAFLKLDTTSDSCGMSSWNRESGCTGLLNRTRSRAYGEIRQGYTNFITYKDPEIQREASDLLVYGADSLHQMIPSLSFDNADKLLQAVFAAEYARVVDQVENLALFSLANRLLEKQSDKDTCPKTTTGDEHGMIGK